MIVDQFFTNNDLLVGDEITTVSNVFPGAGKDIINIISLMDA